MASTTTQSTSWTTWLKGRWPTALALAGAALMIGGGGPGQGVGGFGHILPLLPLLYLVMAKLRRREWTWPGLGIGSVAVFGLQALDIPAAVVLSGIALVVLVWAGVDGQVRRDGALRTQALGMLIFGGLALAGLAVDPELGRYLVAAGWFFHGVWDFAHLRANKVVARSFAEWCGVVDIVIGLALVLLP
ncbi:hypothetical protein DP939_08185 [Spongiactinospora rosea]|uniref:Uncharacterized protein n=1 Tax=Spongiactinospora rosea TaxID=2248750 RepID=A0A366M6E7_9ACTN|nr:hypothetical protein [Spongiactinospora rosea]RBQ21022.1 hypothetical protein DP939_08185 [Spongiactinospora rosea]